MRFEDATTLTPAGDGRFAWEVPDGWQQGRGAWGGIVAGGAARAVAASEPEPGRVLRTLSIHMSGPLPAGRATVVVEPLRVGSGLSTWAVTIRDSDGGLAAHAVAVTGGARALDLAQAAASWGTVVPPELPPWRAVEPQDPPRPPFPVFTQHVQFRPVASAPVSGGPARCQGYVGFADDGPWDAASLLALVDAWWVTALTALNEMRPLATVTYDAQLLVDPATVPGSEPLAYEAFMSAAHEGFTSETRRLWTSDGRLAVENHQTVVVIR